MCITKLFKDFIKKAACLESQFSCSIQGNEFLQHCEYLHPHFGKVVRGNEIGGENKRAVKGWVLSGYCDMMFTEHNLGCLNNVPILNDSGSSTLDCSKNILYT